MCSAIGRSCGLMTRVAPEEKQAWSPVKLDKHYVVRDGLCNKPHVLESMEIRTPYGISNFVRVGKMRLGCSNVVMGRQLRGAT